MNCRRCWESPIAACHKGTLPPNHLIFSIFRKNIFFRIIQAVRSRPTKIYIGFEFCRSKYTYTIKLYIGPFSIFFVTVHNCMTFGIIYPDFSGWMEFSWLMRYYFKGFWPVESKSGNHFFRPALETPIIWKISVFPDYRGIAVSGDGNGQRIWILQVKIHELKEIPYFLKTLQ